jgi:mannose-1-phosphate guanylyltransferase
MEQRGQVWAIVLAGGEGSRLKTVTTGPDGEAVPKQFCRTRDDRTLVDLALERAAGVAGQGRTRVLVVEGQRGHWEPGLACWPRLDILVQPLDRGTAPALLGALIPIVREDPAATVICFPSDHEFDDEATLHRSLIELVNLARLWPMEVFVLGVPAVAPDCTLGWMLPGPAGPQGTWAVASFVEKPGPAQALELMRGGAYWSTFIIAARATLLLELYARRAPGLYESYPRWEGDGGAASRLLHDFYRRLPPLDFVRLILQPEPGRLRFLPLPDCGWADIGTPERLGAWLGRHPGAHFRAGPGPGAPLLRGSGAWRATGKENPT